MSSEIKRIPPSGICDVHGLITDMTAIAGLLGCSRCVQELLLGLGLKPVKELCEVER